MLPVGVAAPYSILSASPMSLSEINYVCTVNYTDYNSKKCTVNYTDDNDKIFTLLMCFL